MTPRILTSGLSTFCLVLLLSCGEPASVADNPVAVVRVAPEVGAIAPGFSADDPEGRSIALKSFRGRVVLLDFWATWCEPCIADLPNLKERWARYKGEDFLIIGISLDSDLPAWRSFIRNEGIDWVNLAEGRRWDSEIAARYQVNGIPASFLLDRDGTVLAINARGARLDSAIVTALRN